MTVQSKDLSQKVLFFRKKMADDISQEDLDYIDTLFDLMDIDKDGSISLRELTKCKQNNTIPY